MKAKWIKIMIILIVYILVCVGGYFLLKIYGLNSLAKIRNFIDRLGVMGYIIFFLLQVVISTFICIVPLEDELLVLFSILLFGPIKGCFVSVVGMFITSTLQFLIGRYFCKGIIVKLIGGDNIEKYQNYLKVKGEIMLPILYLIPLFPHDCLCVLAGMSKMKYWYFAPVTLVLRSIEIVCVCFLGGGMIDFSTLQVFDWIVVINILIIDIYLILRLHKYIENKINKN